MPSESSSSAAALGPDEELEALPPPRHPWRNATLLTLALTLLCSLWLVLSLRGEIAYSLSSAPPLELGELGRFSPGPEHANRWVRAQGELDPGLAVAYRRPLERDSYRLARVSGNARLWVQVVVPRDDQDPEHRRFVPPTSFVGRLVSASALGLRFSDLSEALRAGGQPELPSDAWLLIDGEAPSGTRWTLGLALLLLGFAAFTLFGLLRLLRPIRD
jgi:hypothetical protein